MKDITCEAFIDWCNDMYIAEESVHSVKKDFKAEMMQVKKLQSQAEAAKGDSKKMIECYKEALKILKSLENKVDNMEESAFEKAASGAATILSIASGVCATIGLNKLFKLVDTRHPIASLITGAVVSAKIWSVTDSTRYKKVYTQSELLTEIQGCKSNIESGIEILSNPNKYGKYLLGSDFANGNYNSIIYDKWMNEMKPLINELLNVLNKNIAKKLNGLGCEGKFVISKGNSKYIEFSNMDGVDDCFDKHERDVTDILESMNKLMKEFITKNKSRMNKYGVNFEWNNPDDWFYVCIEPSEED